MSLISKVMNKISEIKIYNETRKLVSDSPSDLVHFGSSYGGWTVPSSCVRPGAVAICAGAGEDLSFDVELNRRGMDVYIVDPTPRAKTHYAQLSRALRDSASRPAAGIEGETPYDLDGLDPDRFHFVDKGLWSRQEVLKFFVPDDEAHVSHSVKNLFKTKDYFEAECTTPKALCEALKLPRPDILKMDIEGAEHEVIDSMCADGFLPDVLCVEFDEARTNRDDLAIARLRDTIAELRVHGYRLVDISDFWNFTFTRA